MAGYGGALGEFAQHQSTALNRAQQRQSQQAIAANNPYGLGMDNSYMQSAWNPYGVSASPMGPSPFPGFSNLPYPGETQSQTTARMQKEYELMGQRPLPAEWDAQRPGGEGMFGAGGSYGYGAAGGGGMGGPDPLEQQRQLAFGALEQQKQFYNRPQARELEGAIMEGLRGTSSPWDKWKQSALADSADAAAGGYQSALEQINRGAANAGVKVGGAAYNVGRDVRAQQTQQRRQIESEGTVRKAQDMERARGEEANLLRDMAANQWAPTQAEVGLRSRFEVTGQSPFSGAFGGSPGTAGVPGQTIHAASYNPYQAGGGLRQANGSYGGVTMIPGMNASPWQSGGSSERNNRGTPMGFDLSGYTNYAPGTTDRNYGPQQYYSPVTGASGSWNQPMSPDEQRLYSGFFGR